MVYSDPTNSHVTSSGKIFTVASFCKIIIPNEIWIKTMQVLFGNAEDGERVGRTKLSDIYNFATYDRRMDD